MINYTAYDFHAKRDDRSLTVTVAPKPGGAARITAILTAAMAAMWIGGFLLRPDAAWVLVPFAVLIPLTYLHVKNARQTITVDETFVSGEWRANVLFTFTLRWEHPRTAAHRVEVEHDRTAPARKVFLSVEGDEDRRECLFNLPVAQERRLEAAELVAEALQVPLVRVDAR